MKKIILVLFLLNFLIVSNALSDEIADAKQKSGIELFLENYDWNNMWKEVTTKAKFTTCKPKSSKKGFVSFFKATLVEPLYLAESTIKKGELKATNSTIFNSAEDQSETGSASDKGGVYVNVMKFPIMNMLLKNTNRGLMAFEKGNPKIIYLGVTDPKAWNNILAISMTPEKQKFATMKAAIAPAISCLAASTLEELNPSTKRDSITAARLKDTINIFYYATACLGPNTTGTSTEHQDPINNGLLAISSVFTDMFSRRGVTNALDSMHTTQNILNGYSKDILCHPVINPIFPKTAFTVQLIYPTVSKTHEWGTDPSVYNFQDAGEAGKLVVFAIGQRRDFAQLAYQD